MTTVHVEWGLAGARALAGHVDVLVVVDVLSFTTAVDVALGRGAVVLPFGVRDPAAARAFAAHHNARLAVGRRHTTPAEPFSLSPASLRAIEPGTRLVLPSPNGSAISAEATRQHRQVLAGCLRNATAVAHAAQRAGQQIGIIAAGERWPDGSLRPALEDLLGAGALVRALRADCSRSPEAELAAAAFEHAASSLRHYLEDSVSGLELAALGFAHDVVMAAELDVSTTVPRFSQGAYTAEPEMA